MSGPDLLKTALLLGGLPLFAFLYGIFYGLGMMQRRQDLRAYGFAFYALQCLLTLLILWFSPLAIPWKFVVAMGTIGFAAIPPLTCRLLELIHE